MKFSRIRKSGELEVWINPLQVIKADGGNGLLTFVYLSDGSILETPVPLSVVLTALNNGAHKDA